MLVIDISTANDISTVKNEPVYIGMKPVFSYKKAVAYKPYKRPVFGKRWFKRKMVSYYPFKEKLIFAKSKAVII